VVDVIVDTSVIIEKIRTNRGLFDKLIDKAKKGKVGLYTSAVVITELWMGQGMKYKESVMGVEDLLESMRTITIDREIGKKAGELIRGKQVEGFDALIAASALVLKFKLATLNVKHFKKIKGLKLYNS